MIFMAISIAYIETSSCGSALSNTDSKIDYCGAFEFKQLARFCRGSNLETKALDDLPHLMHLACIALGQSTFPQPQAVLQANAYIAAHTGTDSGNPELVSPGSQH
jgi:hypothetical protein